MQLVGQGGKQSPQPEHRELRIECTRLAAPTMESIGQASMHSVHPIRNCSSINAVASRFEGRMLVSRGTTGYVVIRARSWMTCSPPGAQRLMFSFDSEIACA